MCNLEADALAAAEAAQLAPGTRLAVMNDARMQEAYSALYEVVEGPRGVREVLAPQLVKPADARRWLEEAKVDALCRLRRRRLCRGVQPPRRLPRSRNSRRHGDAHRASRPRRRG
ncbi:MAG: hypothetical protein ACLUNV_04695 [Sutterella wadsworthensis]